MLVEQAPPSKMLRTLQHADKNNYIQHVLKLHENLHGNGPTRIRRAERRDAGTPRAPASGIRGPDTEAGFGRKREAGIADIVAASPSKRARRRDGGEGRLEFNHVLTRAVKPPIEL